MGWVDGFLCHGRVRFRVLDDAAFLLADPARRKKTVTLPLDTTAPATFTLSQTLVHASHALPEHIGQDDEQFLMFERNETFVESLYKTRKETIKYRCVRVPSACVDVTEKSARSPSKKILSYSTPPEAFVPVGGAPSKKSGGTLTLGPFTSVPATVALSRAGTLVRESQFPQAPIRVHYPFEEPVRTVEKLTRLVEVSHWGGNVNVEDHVRLVNTGAK